MASDRVKFTIFLPRQVLKMNKGILLGCIDVNKNEQSVHVMAVCESDRISTATFLKIVGGFASSVSPCNLNPQAGSQFFLTLDAGKNSEMSFQVHYDGLKKESVDCVVILYDPSEFLTSEIFSDDECNGCEIFATLMKALRRFRALPLEDHLKWESFLSEDKLEMERRNWCTAAVLALLSFLLVVVDKLKNSRFIAVRKILLWNSLGRQMLTRGNQIEEMCRQCCKKRRLSIRFWNVMSALLVDVILGISVIVIVERTASLWTILEWALEWTRTLVTNLREIVVWLMDVPAGFKLNYPLNKALGTFFLFHIHLWEAYVYIIKPMAFNILEVAMCCGIFGITFQLSVLQDLVSIATFHIYCFYAYAAKMYNLQITGLVSMWRLFCGKKWNPLRKRVDSCSYDVEQLFLGTLVLTILLFLLTTTLTYYVVFTALRLAVLFIHGIISLIIQIVNGLSPYAVVLHFFGSKVVNANVVFVPAKHVKGNQPLQLHMKVTSSRLSDIISQFQLPVQNRSGRQAWAELIKCVLSGQLVYPI